MIQDVCELLTEFLFPDTQVYILQVHRQRSTGTRARVSALALVVADKALDEVGDLD
jgi:hypothetical protein